MVRNASAVWKGGLKDGKGEITSGSGVLKSTPYNFVQRFEDAPGTNPEELIGAAHAGCYSMQLSGVLGKANKTADSIETKASVHFEKLDVGFTISRIHLDVVAKIPGISPEEFLKAAEEAKRICPISRVLNATITLEAKLA